jgi:predicted nucleic-acid-binding Zn-ribbon protein
MSTMREGMCPQCHSREILPNANTADRHTLSVQVYENSGVRPRGRRSFPIKAWICTQCGYTELYVANPDDLARSYRRSLVSFA